MVVGCSTFIFGQKFKETASLIKVYEPVIKAWLAITAAAVEIRIPGMRNQVGMME